SDYAHIEPIVQDFFNSLSSQAIIALNSLLTAEEAEALYQAAWLLNEMGRGDERVVEALVSLLSADEAGVRYQAAELLNRMGRGDERVVEALASLLAADEA